MVLEQKLLNVWSSSARVTWYKLDRSPAIPDCPEGGPVVPVHFSLRVDAALGRDGDC